MKECVCLFGRNGLLSGSVLLMGKIFILSRLKHLGVGASSVRNESVFLVERSLIVIQP